MIALRKGSFVGLVILALSSWIQAAMTTYQFNGAITGDWTKGNFAIGDWGFKIEPANNYTISRTNAGVVTIKEIDGTKDFSMKLFYAAKSGSFAVQSLGFINSSNSGPNNNNNFYAQMHASFGSTSTSIPEYQHTNQPNILFTAFGVTVVDTVSFTDYEFGPGYYNTVNIQLSNFVAEVVAAPRVSTILRQNPTTEQTKATSLTWRVAFSEPVCKDTLNTNLSASDFAVTGTTATITSVTGVNAVSGTCAQSTYDVTASGGDLSSVAEGTPIYLNVLSGAYNFPVNKSGYKVVNTTPTTTNNNYFTIVRSTAPTLSSTAANPSYTENGSAVKVFSTVSASTVEGGQQFTSLQMTISNVVDAPNEIINVAGTDIVLKNGQTGLLANYAGSYSVAINANIASVSFTGISLTDYQMSSMLAAITYRHSGETPTVGGRTIAITGLSDNGSFNNSASFSGVQSSVNVIPVNDAPVLVQSGFNLTAISEDDAASAEYSVSTLLSSATYTDVDNSSSGLALTQVSGNGQWQYLLSGGNWTTVGSVSASSSLLLPSTAKLRFVPDKINGGTATIVLRGWDLTTGVAGSFVASTTNGNSSAFSASTSTATLNVTAVNDAPVVVVPALFSGNEDNAISLSSLTISDPDAGVDAVSLTFIVAQGSWTAGAMSGVSIEGQGTTQLKLTAPVATMNIYLAAGKLSYVPVADFNGDLALQVNVDDLGHSGGVAKTASASSTIRIAAINDAPVLVVANWAMDPTDRHSASTAIKVSDLLANLLYHDVDVNAQSGIAIVAMSGPGGWQYSSDGQSWQVTPAVSDAQAFLLPSSYFVRFLPSAASDGAASLKFRAWDQSTGVALSNANTIPNGAASSFSAILAEIQLTIKTNEPPTAIYLSNQDIRQSQGAMVKVGDLTSDEPEGATSFTYSLVAGNGDADNVLFTIKGSALYAINASTLAVGEYHVRIMTTEGANSYSQSFTLVAYDDVIPGIPVIATTSHSTREADFDIQGVAEASSELTLYANSAELTKLTVEANGHWSFHVKNIPEGKFFITAQASDASGNKSLLSDGILIAVDYTAPIIPTISESQIVSVQRSFPVQGECEVASRIILLLDGAQIDTIACDGMGKWSYTLKNLSDGKFSLAVQGTDSLDNTSEVSAVTSIQVDATAPMVPSIESAQLTFGQSSVPVTGTCEAKTQVFIFADGVQVAKLACDVDGKWSYTYTGLLDGAHSLSAQSEDEVGNVSAVSSTITIWMDTTAPQSPVIATLVNQDGKLTITGTAEANSQLALLIDGQESATTTVDATGQWQIVVTTIFSEGTHLAQAQATDSLGHVSTLGASVEWTIDVPTALRADVVMGNRSISYRHGVLEYSGLRGVVVIRNMAGRQMFSAPVAKGNASIPVNLPAGQYVVSNGEYAVQIAIGQ